MKKKSIKLTNYCKKTKNEHVRHVLHMIPVWFRTFFTECMSLITHSHMIFHKGLYVKNIVKSCRLSMKEDWTLSKVILCTQNYMLILYMYLNILSKQIIKNIFYWHVWLSFMPVAIFKIHVTCDLSKLSIHVE